MLADPLTLILILIITLFLAIALWIFFLRAPLSLLVITLGIFALYVVLSKETISFEIGKYSINILDILSAFLLSNAIGRFIIYPKPRTKEIIFVLLLGVLLFVSWLRGIFIFNLETASNSFRTYLYFFAVLFYTCTLSFSQLIFQKIIFWLKISSLSIIITAFIRWFLVTIGQAYSPVWIAPNGNMVRVLTAPATFLLLQLAFFLFFSRKSKTIFYFYSIAIAVLLCMIVVLQQRTVWAALLISSLLIILLRSKIKNLIVLSILFIIVLGVFILILNDFSLEALIGTPLDLHNLNWRILGWQQLLNPERFQSPLDYFLGQPFGTSYSRYILNSVNETTVSPHNFYVQTFLNIGGAGFILLIFLYWTIFKSLWSLRKESISQLFVTLLAAQLVFYLTYAPSFEQGLFLGLALIYSQQKRDKLEIEYKLVDMAIGQIDEHNTTGLLRK